MARFVHLTEFRHLNASAEHTLAVFRRRFGFPSGPPVPVEMIALALFGLRCELRRLGHLGNNTVGAFSVDDGIIFVDEGCNRHQYVFAVAHEIGHQVLHEGAHSPSQVLSEDTQTPVLERILGSGRARTKKQRSRLREIEANRFAGALLIPRPLLLRETTNYDVVDQRAVRELARRFHVSIKAMVCRINDLSRHLAWDGPPIDFDSVQRLEAVLAQRLHSEKQGGDPSASTSQSASATSTFPGATNRRGPRSFPVRKLQATRALDSLVEFAGGHSTYLTPRRNDPAKERAIGQYRRRRQGGGLVKRDQKKPVIVEFAGTSNAGKDTLIQIVKDYLEDVHGYRVRVFDEGVKFCHIDKSLHDIDLLYKTVALSVLQLYEATFENPGDYDFVIFNRGLFDRLVFVRAAQLCGLISQDHARIHTEYLLSYAPLQDILCLFFISPTECLRREREGKRSIVAGLAAHRDGIESLPEQTILNEEMLTLLNSSYLYARRAYKDSFDPTYFFNLADWKDANILQESLLGKARGLADAILPGNSTQLPFPELFGMCYVSENLLREGIATPEGHLSKSSHQMPVQLSLPWGGMPGGTTSMRTVPLRTRATTA